MKLVKPVAFQESQLISTTATNADANWSSATTYSLGQKVSYSGKTWESLQASNLNKTPTTEPTWWLDLGADNKHAMFDQIIGTSTAATTSMTVVVKPGVVIDSIALINMEAATAKITCRNGLEGDIVYEQTAGLSGSTVQDWYQYFFFDPLLKRTQFIFYNIPQYLDLHITLELTNSSGSAVSIAQMIYGTMYEIGLSQYGATAGIVDYSVKETDDFGNTSFVKRAYSKRFSAEVYVKNTDLNRVQRTLYDVRATPSVWIATDDPLFEEALIVYGWYRDFTTNISYPKHSIVSIELESLT